ncbi:MAG: hypothetical protein P8N76_11295 [Pirellulaceae bacterium]|nr:hypothetical protein [Pirellulaceae bacterium]
MLTGNDAATAAPPSVTSETASKGVASDAVKNRLERVLRIEWLGQTVASVCWIGSVLTYGISSSGDWLQLFAASSWLLANIAAAVTIEAN